MVMLVGLNAGCRPSAPEHQPVSPQPLFASGRRRCVASRRRSCNAPLNGCLLSFGVWSLPRSRATSPPRHTPSVSEVKRLGRGQPLGSEPQAIPRFAAPSDYKRASLGSWRSRVRSPSSALLVPVTASVPLAAVAPNLAHQPLGRVVVLVGYALLEGDDGVVGNLDPDGTDLGAAFGDVAVS